MDTLSAVSVGPCLAHVAMDRAPWLALREVEADWPVQGKPRRIGVDNGAEFHSEAFEPGCERWPPSDGGAATDACTSYSSERASC